MRLLQVTLLLLEEEEDEVLQIFDYKDLNVQSSANAIDFNYFDVMDIKVLKGRGFRREKSIRYD